MVLVKVAQETEYIYKSVFETKKEKSKKEYKKPGHVPRHESLW